MRRLVPFALALLAALALAGPAPAAETWHSQQPPGGGGYPLLGDVGDLECWNGEANRCLLITAGNAGVAPGIFAYDGNGWYRYSTVCGGHEGRIAWAGPTEFWTISDQQPGGQIAIPGQAAETYYNVSLCHFKDGQVVASYGEPAGATNSYLHMSAAACASPSDCWFAGERLPGTVNPGAFHLHWNGSTLSAVPSLTQFSDLGDPGRSVSDLAIWEGDLYEGVDVREGDQPSAAEAEREAEGLGPSFLHRIDPGKPQPFEPLFGQSGFSYGEASELEGFRLTGEPGEQLWAIAGSPESGSNVTVLRLGEAGLTQLLPSDGEGALGPETLVMGVAADPGPGDDAWVAYRPRADQLSSSFAPARLVRLHGDGTIDPKVELPLAGEEFAGEPVGRKGVAGPIACPAPEQCWLATRRGWLFHLGGDPAPQADPALHVLINSRPPDNSLPSLPPLELPEDNSGAEEEPSDQEEVPSPFEPPPRQKPALLSKIKQRLVGETVLELSFTLSAKAKVWLIAKKKRHVVVRTKRQTMAKGRRSIRVRLDPRRWPTKLDLKAKKVKAGKGSKGSK